VKEYLKDKINELAMDSKNKASGTCIECATVQIVGKDRNKSNSDAGGN
jgi:hypothetical protein